MIREAYDSYVHEVYKELYETLTEGTQQIRLNNIGEAEVITNNGYIYNPNTEDMDGSVFFTGRTMSESIAGKVKSIWLYADEFPELAKLVREKVLPEVIEKEVEHKRSLLICTI